MSYENPGFGGCGYDENGYPYGATHLPRIPDFPAELTPSPYAGYAEAAYGDACAQNDTGQTEGIAAQYPDAAQRFYTQYLHLDN